MMKLLIIFFVFASYVSVNGNDINSYRVELLDPKGYRVFGPENTRLDGEPINGISFFGSIIPTTKAASDHWDTTDAGFEKRSDGKFVYQNTTAFLNPGDTLRFQSREQISDYITISEIRDYLVPADAPRVPV